MNKRVAKAEACFIATLWIHSALDEGALETRCDLLSEADGDRLRRAMDEVLGDLERRASKLPAVDYDYQQKGLEG